MDLFAGRSLKDIVETRQDHDSSSRTHAPQQHERVPTDDDPGQPLPKIQQPAALDMKHPQTLLLAAAPIVHVLYLQRLGRRVQHPADGPVPVVEEGALRQLRRRRLGRGLDVEVDAPLGQQLGVALCRLLELVEHRDTSGGHHTTTTTTTGRFSWSA